MNTFLKIKHWQLFLLVVGIPFLASLVMSVAVEAVNRNTFLTATLIIGTTLGSALLGVGTMLGWFYAIGKGLQLYLPESAKGGVNRLKVFALIPCLYIAGLTIYMITGTFESTFANGGGAAALMALIMVLLHLFSMFCIFYSLYFAAKTVKAAELRRPVTFGDFAGEFFLMWFFPVGIWIIQPRVNKIVAQPPGVEMDIFRQTVL